MFLELLQTVIFIEESPADKVESASELAPEFLRTLHIGNLLEEFVGCREVSQFKVGQVSTVAHFVNPVDGLLCGAVDFVFTFGGAEQHIGVTHQTQVDSIVQTCNNRAIETGTKVCELGDGQTTVCVVGYDVVSGCKLVRISYITELEIFPVGFISTDGPVQTWVEFPVSCTLSFEEMVEPRGCRDVCPTTIIAGSEVTLDGRTLGGIRAGVHRSPLVVGSL